MTMRFLVIILSFLHIFSSAEAQSKGNGEYVVRGVRVGSGRIHPLANSFDTCVRLCQSHGRCRAVNFNEHRRTCELVNSIAQCSQPYTIDVNSIVYKSGTCDLKEAIEFLPREPVLFNKNDKIFANDLEFNQFGRQSSACTGGNLFIVSPGMQVVGGTQITGVTGILGCLQYCEVTPTCQAVDVNLIDQTCWSHETQSVPTLATCCYHFTKQCVQAPGVTTTPGVPVTELPRHPPISGIPREGSCPLSFVSSVNSNMNNPATVLSDISSTQCQVTCFQDDLCLAADYDATLLQCSIHFSYDTNNLNIGTQSCCTHYRKLRCPENECYVQFYSYSGNIATTPPVFPPFYITADTNTPSEPCASGFCFLQSFTDLSDPTAGVINIRRGCASGTTVKPLRCDDTMGTSNSREINCICQGSKCNSYDPNGFNSLMAYYPLDNHTMDLSGYFRHGKGQNLRFSLLDSKKNISALFDGTSSVEVVNAVNLVIASLDQPIQSTPGINGPLNPGLTVTLWIKRFNQGGKMALLSNGIEGRAGIEVLADSTAGTGVQNVIAFLRTGDGVTFTSSVQTPVDVWVFLSITLSGVPTPTASCNFEMKMYAGTSIIDDIGASTDCQMANAPLKTNILPLTIGKQRAEITTSQGAALSSVQHYVGYVDEVMIYRNALMPAALQSILDSTKP